VLFDLSGNPVLPAGDGVIAEWVFDVRADAAEGMFPLTLVVNQARNGPLRVTLNVDGAGEIAIQGPTVTPTSIVDTPTATATATATSTSQAPATNTATATPTAPEMPTTTTATATVTATPTVEATRTDTPNTSVCVGDCNGDGEVTINELILGVNIALGNQPISACEAFDCQGTGMVPINCLIQGVNNASNGCPPGIDIGPLGNGPRG
jgi:hypothetical protein